MPTDGSLVKDVIRILVAGPIGRREGLKRTTGKRWSWLRREWMGDRVTSISLLTAAMEINNVIGHALEETPQRIKESLLFYLLVMV